MACAVAIQSQLAPCNALDVWRLADCYTLPALEKVAVEAALRGFGELPPWSATGAQVLALVQTDSLVAKSEKAVFQLVVAVVGGRRAARGRAARGGDEARASCGDERGFVEGTVQPWLALVSIDDVALDYVVVDQWRQGEPGQQCSCCVPPWVPRRPTDSPHVYAASSSCHSFVYRLHRGRFVTGFHSRVLACVRQVHLVVLYLGRLVRQQRVRRSASSTDRCAPI